MWLVLFCDFLLLTTAYHTIVCFDLLNTVLRSAFENFDASASALSTCFTWAVVTTHQDLFLVSLSLLCFAARCLTLPYFHVAKERDYQIDEQKM